MFPLLIPFLVSSVLARPGTSPETPPAKPSPGAGVAVAPFEDLSIDGATYRRIERRANAFTASAQEAVALDADAAGRAVVVWQSRRQEEGTYGVFARRFSAAGAPITDEVHVNLTTWSHQMRPAVAVDPLGVWFAWESFGQDGDQGSIVARRFDGGLAKSGGEILVNEGVAEGHQESLAVASDSRGNAVVAWTTPGAGPDERWVLARRFDGAGRPIGAAIRIGTAAGVRDSLPCVGFDAAGGFTLAWARAQSDGKPAGIFARRFGPDGVPLGGEIEISERDGQMHIEPALAVSAQGDLALAWFSARSDGEGGYGVTLRLARATEPASENALELGPQRAVATGTPGYTSGLAIARDPEGGLLLAWSGFGDAKGDSDLFARLLSKDGEPNGEVFRVAAASAEHQRLQAASGAKHAWLGGDGRMLFAWSGNADQGDKSGAHLTLLAPAELDLGKVERAAPEVADAPAFEDSSAAEPQHHEPPTFDPRDRVERSQAMGEENAAGPDFGFLGITNTGWTPPDPHLSVGPSHIVLMTNGAIAFFQKNGTLDFQDQIEGAGGFWGAQGAGGFVFDPETCFDPHSNRFMAMACERTGGQSFFLYAVSDDSNPNGTWHKYRFNVTVQGGDDIDSPEMAVDSSTVYLCADFFSPDAFLVFTVQKAPTLSGGVPLTNSLLISGTQSYGVPVTYGTPPAQYMIEALEAGSNTQIRLHAIQNPLTGPTDTTVLINVPVYQQPEDPPQMGTTLRPELFESRFWSCVYRNGSLWATHHTGSSRVIQRWYEIDMANWPTSGTPTVVQQGDIDPGPTVRTFFGSIWVDANDNAGMVFSRSSPTEFISMARCFRRASDPLGTMTPSVIVQTSNSPETSGRWGDYSGTGVDPSTPGAFWGYHEYRTSSWRTWVSLFGPCEAPTNYCVGKMNSQGVTPSIGSSGEPSVGSNSFAVEVNDALPNKLGLLWWSDNPDSTPFAGGTRCVLPPLHRGGTFATDSFGFASKPHATTLPLLGQPRYFQIFTRDGAHPDGTGLSLTDGLRAVFCP